VTTTTTTLSTTTTATTATIVIQTKNDSQQHRYCHLIVSSPVHKVIVELQHPQLGILENKEAHVNWHIDPNL
jgi:hypothetical protein